MKTKHKLIQDYQFVSSDKKIFVLKIGTILEEYVYKLKGEEIPIDREVVDANPQFFQLVDWKTELNSYLKVNKIPQPAQISKKVIPFIEDMILSSISGNTAVSVSLSPLDEERLKEVERKEVELNNREKRIKDKEEESEIRLKMVEKRESEWKDSLKVLDGKEDQFRLKLKSLTDRELDIETKFQSMNERERNLDRQSLESSKDIDAKWSELREKVDIDLEAVSVRERELDNLSKDLKIKEDSVKEIESSLSDSVRDFEIKLGEFKMWEEEVRKIDEEIKDWETLHWKFKRMRKPPSAI